MNDEQVYKLSDWFNARIEGSGFHKLRQINDSAPKDRHRGLGVSNASYIKFKKVKLRDKTKESTEDRPFSACRELSKKLTFPNP